MKRNKKARYHSPASEKAEYHEVSSFDSGLDVSNADSDESLLPDSLAGKIDSLHMENFMCHSNLEISFNKRITFVTGKNGSGKSTIMAALIVALGGSANTTGRGTGILDFIKKGATWARVTVTLVNEGINTYKRNVYRNRIVIVRNITKTSASSYICKSEFGETISKKKDEVDKVITALDIQIKNPICILNQDVARTFLTTADSSSRYSMFMKATHLENLKDIYTDTIDLLCTSQKELEQKKHGVSEASKEISVLKTKLEYFASLEKYTNERTSLENEYLWSLVIAEEKSLEELRDKRKKVEEKAKEFNDNGSNYEEIINQLQQHINEIQEKISELGNNQGKDKKVRKKELQAEIQNFQRQIDNVNVHLKQLVMKSERHLSEINSIKEHLQQSEDMESQSKAERDKITQRINELNNDLSELRDRIETTQRDTDNGIETKLQHTITLENSKSELNDLERSKRILEVQVERTANAGDNNLLKYGPFTPRLKELIDEAAKRNQFQKKPVGPCGLYVSLSGDRKWARAVESVISGLMSTYCCDNQKDFQVLTSLMDKVCRGKNPPIIISRFQKSRHNVASEKVSVRGLNSVLDVLEFTNDVVFNTFIDQARLETILLFETDAQAASLLTHVQNVPKNLRMGLTLQSDQYYPAPNYRTYYGDSNRPLKYFDTTSRSKAVKEKLKEDIHKALLTIKDKNMEIAEVTSKLVKVTEFLKKTESHLRLLKQNERQIEAQIKQLKNEAESKPVLPTRLVLEEELSELEKKQKDVEESIKSDKGSVETLSKDKEERARELENILEEENSVQREISNLKEKLGDTKYKLNLEKTKKENLKSKFDEIKLELDKVKQEISIKKKSLMSKIEAAKEVHEKRVETERSPLEVQKLLEKCEKYLKAADEKIDSKEVVINEYKIKHKRYKSMKRTVDVLEGVMDSLFQIAMSKKERFKILQSHTANLVSFHFQACLQTRGYDGQLKFDFKNQTLEIEVIPKDGLVRKDTKTLSGGERSYSSVSFILAIWRAVQIPFYFLDEFDVFMDKVNRKVIMDLLMEHAKNQTKMQFIFITPQDISNIQSSGLVSVYRMPDPRLPDSA